MCPPLAPVFQGFFLFYFPAAINNAYKENKAGGMPQ
jgi:hypothetical protein